MTSVQLFTFVMTSPNSRSLKIPRRINMFLWEIIQFKEFENSKEDQHVLMRNNIKVKVLGKGFVELKIISKKKLTLVNVLFVPELKKNLVFATLLCKKRCKGCYRGRKVDPN
ncbi:hypothetical protein ACH5RR_029891 [Cinchona calisaya]|uniref:Retrovirus-related Pol polyprotein from transposon TNT 1-94-like beta-barrel domain-containing protein n=1 Tax=Cinchona calisaya TaxID=153742 RepID=A0ABD2YWU1_9GENT